MVQEICSKHGRKAGQFAPPIFLYKPDVRGDAVSSTDPDYYGLLVLKKSADHRDTKTKRRHHMLVACCLVFLCPHSPSCFSANQCSFLYSIASYFAGLVCKHLGLLRNLEVHRYSCLVSFFGSGFKICRWHCFFKVRST